MTLDFSTQTELAVQLLCAAGFGAAIGLERSWRAHIAGVRTHALVAVGAALFTIAGAYGFADFDRGPTIDPMRVAAQVASGIGFIGAGAIIRNGRAVRGVTTAASLWMSAAVGVAAGAGLLVVAAISVVVTFVVLIGFRAVQERSQIGRRSCSIEVEYRRGHGTLGVILPSLEAIGPVRSVSIDDDADDPAQPGTRVVTIEVAARDMTACSAVAAELEARDEVLAVQLH